MRIFLFVILVLVSFIRTSAQKGIILRSRDGQVTDTLDNRSFYSVKNDTLTRFLIGKSSSTDRCSSFSIIRHRYIKGQDGFHQVRTRAIVIGSRCSSLLNEDNIYCLRLTDFKFKNGTVKVTIVDSNDRKFRAALRESQEFENQLKDKVDKFINNSACNGVRIE